MDYEKHGFGPKIKTENELINALETIINKGLDNRYKIRYENF